MSRFWKKGLLPLLGLLLIVSFLLGAMAGCGNKTTEAKTLKIGVITSMSGDLSGPFKGMADAMKPTQDLYNNKGGITIAGQKYNIELVAYDDQSSAAGAVTAANKAIQDGVKFVIAPVYPVALRAVIPITNEAKVVTFSATQVDPTAFTPEYKYTFNCDMTVFHMGATHAYLQDKYPAVKKIATVAPVDPGVDYIIKMSKEDFAARGLEVVSLESFTPDTQDFYPVLTKTLAKNPDAIQIPGGMPFWVGGTINAARDLGFKGPIFASAIVGGLGDIKALITPGYDYGFFEGCPDVESSKMPQEVQDLNVLVKEQLGHPQNFDNFQVIGALSVCLQGLQKANSLDPDKVVAALEGMTFKSPMGGNGKFIKLESYIHLGIMDVVAVGTIENGVIGMSYVANSKY